MPSIRKVKTIGLTALLAALVILYYTHGAANTRSASFYTSTKHGLDSKHAPAAAAAKGDSEVFEHIDKSQVKAQAIVEEPDEVVRDAVRAKEKQAEEAILAAGSSSKEKGKDAKGGKKDKEKSKDKGASKEMKKPGSKFGGPYEMAEADDEEDEADGEFAEDEEEAAAYGAGASAFEDGEEDGEFEETETGEEVSVAGRKSWKIGKGKDGKKKEKEKILSAEEEEEVRQKAIVEAELNDILKRSPIIIFSKTYCPYSRKAKSIMLDKYAFVPAPYVVELDIHELGPSLQAVLAEHTGRKTVPNVLINGKSIGGGDDIAQLDKDGELISQVRVLGGKRILEGSLRDSAAGEKGEKGKDKDKDI